MHQAPTEDTSTTPHDGNARGIAQHVIPILLLPITIPTLLLIAGAIWVTDSYNWTEH